MQTLLNDQQVAETLGIKVGTLRDWRYRGTGPEYVKISHRCVRYRPEDLKKFIDERVYESTTQESE